VTYLIEKGHQVLLAALIFSVILTPLCHAKIGYYIDASVNSTSWSIERSTQDLNFEMASSVSGDGSFSKLMHIKNFAGIELDELSSSSNGSLGYEELMQLQSREGPVSVSARLKSETKESTNESLEISSNEFINIEIDERWPTRLANYKKISYLGPGIRTRESYQNNGDVVATSIDSWRLTKESVYEAQINRMVTTVNITSDDVAEMRYENKTSRYGLGLQTIGSSTHLDVIRLDVSGMPRLVISQDYLGEERMNLNITMNDWLPLPEEARKWLECCSAGDGEEALEDSLTSSMNRFVFDP
jgi:hypothetical protein